jgi:hypothetical protein
MAAEIKENWTYILINGKSKTLEVKVKPSDFEKGRLVKLSEIRPFNNKDSEGNDIIPTAELANVEKRKFY